MYESVKMWNCKISLYKNMKGNRFLIAATALFVTSAIVYGKKDATLLGA